MIRRLIFEFLYLLGSFTRDARISPPEQMTLLESHPPDRALDLGCGTGTNLATMSQVDWQMTSVNLSGRAIHQARPKPCVTCIRQGTDRHRTSAWLTFQLKT